MLRLLAVALSMLVMDDAQSGGTVEVRKDTPPQPTLPPKNNEVRMTASSEMHLHAVECGANERSPEKKNSMKSASQ